MVDFYKSICLFIWLRGVLAAARGIFVGDLKYERSHGGSFLEARGHSSFGARA